MEPSHYLSRKNRHCNKGEVCSTNLLLSGDQCRDERRNALVEKYVHEILECQKWKVAFRLLVLLRKHCSDTMQ